MQRHFPDGLQLPVQGDIPYVVHDKDSEADTQMFLVSHNTSKLQVCINFFLVHLYVQGLGIIPDGTSYSM